MPLSDEQLSKFHQLFQENLGDQLSHEERIDYALKIVEYMHLLQTLSPCTT